MRPRRQTGPSSSDGPLSREFPEVEVKVTSSFAHDRGMVSRVDSIEVGGTACALEDVLPALVALRKGWSAGGGSGDAEVIVTFGAYVEAWARILPHSGRITGAECPPDLRPLLEGTSPRLDYHPPRVALFALDDGDKLAVSASFVSWDGGSHGTQFAYEVEAYRVSNGRRFDLRAPEPGRLEPAPATAGPRPVDPRVPRPRSLSRR